MRSFKSLLSSNKDANNALTSSGNLSANCTIIPLGKLLIEASRFAVLLKACDSIVGKSTASISQLSWKCFTASHL